MIISLIAGMDRKRVIGKNNALPWHVPADLKRFKKLTLGKPVIMGRKTFASIGKLLPDRANIVMTHNPNYRAPGCTIAHSPEEALSAAGNASEIMVIGGAEIFREFLPRANRMYLTLIDADVNGDTYFPEYTTEEWKEISREAHPADKENKYPYTFVVLERILSS